MPFRVFQPVHGFKSLRDTHFLAAVSRAIRSGMFQPHVFFLTLVPCLPHSSLPNLHDNFSQNNIRTPFDATALSWEEHSFRLLPTIPGTTPPLDKKMCVKIENCFPAANPRTVLDLGSGNCAGWAGMQNGDG
jgi:hypothetical protein